ncbi:MAG: F0F1 ATP synthase subunit A [Anaerolineales bacterium]|nr:F0F1 ATP synthase subunit A [Anaerolineales bacterium]
MKKRYIVLLALLGLIVVTAWPLIRPVRPYIQLAGEAYPEVFPTFLGVGILNTFIATVLAYILLFLLPVIVRPKRHTPDEVPTGFYNLVEMVIEGAYGFVEGVVGSDKVKVFFPFFFIFFILVLTVNLMALLPTFDSVGLWEYKPHFKALQSAREAGYEYGSPEWKEYVEEKTHEYEQEPQGDLRVGLFLIGAQNVIEGAEVESVGDHHYPAGRSPEARQWTIVPFVRPGATDLNFTLALAIVGMVIVQVIGFRYLGPSYLKKFFAFRGGFIDAFARNPLDGIIGYVIPPIVGIIELVSEFAKIISFAFRLLGAMFGGMVLLFVMSNLAAVANLAFFGLELFVGSIQAFVFAMLLIIFMNTATHSHDHDHDDGHH